MSTTSLAACMGRSALVACSTSPLRAARAHHVFRGFGDGSAGHGGDRRRAVARYLAGGRCQALGRELFDQECEHRALQGAGAVVGVAGVGEVSLLDRVEREVVELVLVRLGLGDGQRAPILQALVAFAGDGPELGVVVVARELDEVLLAINVDLGDDGLQVVGLLDGRVAVQALGDAPYRAGRRRAALAVAPSLPRRRR